MWSLIAVAQASILVDLPAAEALVARGATVLDSRSRVDFYRGHIPGAQRVDWRIGTVGGLLSGKLGEPGGVATAFAALGVDNQRAVLVVGAWEEGWGEEGRIAWDLAYLGHGDVHLLRGGAGVWRGPWEYLPTSASPGHFTAHPRPELRADIASIQGGSVTLVDVREPEEYAGKAAYGEARGGHIPGAISRPWKPLVEGRAEIPFGPLVTYCTGGVRSAMAWVYLSDAGYPVANYDGGWWEWAREVP